MAYITINRTHFYHNLNKIALKTGSIDKIAIVLKDNAYGHSIDIIASLASEFGIKHAVTRDLEEAEAIKFHFENVLVLAGESRADPRLSFAINSLAQITQMTKGTQVELKVDTGMHRNGIAIEELEEALDSIKLQGLELIGVMTHFRSADELSSDFFWQKKRFEEVKRVVKERGLKVRFHSHNSAAILRSKQFDEDLVRVGIAAYGYDELDCAFDKTDLRPVLAIHAKKVATKPLRKGERVGYGGGFVAPRDMIVSTYNIGYGDGWIRASDKDAYCTDDGVMTLGRVSMDLMVFEGESPSVCVMANAQRAAKHFGTISYEVVTSLSSDIPKIIID